MPRTELLRSLLLSVSYIPSTICVLSKNIFQSNFCGGGGMCETTACSMHVEAGRQFYGFVSTFTWTQGLHTSADLSGLYPRSHFTSSSLFSTTTSCSTIQTENKPSRSEGSAVRNTSCSSRGSQFDFHPRGASEPSITKVPGDPMPMSFSGLSRH